MRLHKPSQLVTSCSEIKQPTLIIGREHGLFVPTCHPMEYARSIRNARGEPRSNIVESLVIHTVLLAPRHLRLRLVDDERVLKLNVVRVFDSLQHFGRPAPGRVNQPVLEDIHL